MARLQEERDDLHGRTSMLGRQLRDTEEQRNITLRQQERHQQEAEMERVRIEEEVAQQRRQLKEATEATLHQKEEDNYGRMMVIIGGVGGAFVVMIGITFFLCNASKKNKIKKVTREMNAGFDSERKWRELKRTMAIRNCVRPKDGRPQPRHVHAAFHEEFGMKEVFPVTLGEGKDLLQSAKELGIKSIIITPGERPEGEPEGGTLDATRTDETPGEDGEDVELQIEAFCDTV